MSGIGARDSEWVWPSVVASPSSSEEGCASPAPARSEAVSNSCSAVSVLIVEDDKAARKAISQILKRRGFAGSEAAGVAEAFAALGLDSRGSRIKEAVEAHDWMLLDLMLPDGC